MFGSVHKEIVAKMLTVLEAGVCKMYGKVSQGMQLWVRLFQLGLSLMSRENNRPYRPREESCAVKRTT